MHIRLFKIYKKRASATAYSLVAMFFASILYLFSYKVYLNTFYSENINDYNMENNSYDIERAISKTNSFFSSEENKNRIQSIKNNKTDVFIIDDYTKILYAHEYDKYYLIYYDYKEKTQIELKMKNINGSIILIPKSKNEKIYNF